jgi:hypothetical protein
VVSPAPTPIPAGSNRSAARRFVRALLVVLLLGFFLVRYVVRQCVRKELAWGASLMCPEERRARADNGT